MPTYNYVANNPLMFSDPYGRDIIPVMGPKVAGGGFNYISKDGFEESPFEPKPIYTEENYKNISDNLKNYRK